ncbi:MAG: cytochrome c oxidase accessory protein CcoG [Magnetococcales bacterium]|nr:cytochrome c oxidase accessory protein CcoG [Magnetococcales bacterium]
MSEEQPSSLYSDWKKIYPRYQTGFFRRLRWSLVALFLGIYYFLPALRWQRAEGLPDQAILFDLPARKFYFFDLVIWPQDIFLLAVILIAAALALFFMTALAGRIFCGYMCFQTVWTDLFLYVEKLFEGNRKQRMKLDSSEWTLHKLYVKVAKHLVWLLIGMATGGAFVFYFADAPTLFWQFLDGTAPIPAWFTLIFLTITTYIMAGIAREQVCIYMCPYARFQGAMFDEDSLIVAYHPELGEPRESNRRIRENKESKTGLCIDCNACVTVCPTGIDIRDGQQYECITCGSCIDACNTVKDRMHMKNELIRYTSMREIQGEKTRWFRPRVLIYGTLLAVFLGGIAVYLAFRPPLSLNVIKHRQPIYITQSDGSIQNNFTIRILNMHTQARTFSLEVDGLANSSLSVVAINKFDKQNRPLIKVASGAVMTFTIYLKQSQNSLKSGSQAITFKLIATDDPEIEDSYDSKFMRP